MKTSIDSVRSSEIQAAYRNAHCNNANFMGSYWHPKHPFSRDYEIELYSVCGDLVFATNGNAVWESSGEDFEALIDEYGVDLYVAIERIT